MRKIILMIIVLTLFVPVTTYAFSFSDLLWWRNKEVVKDKVVELSAQQKITVQEKLAVWSRAYITKDLSLVRRNPSYMTISESELDFILQEKLNEFTNPLIKDVAINLVDGKIILEGYALKPLRGKVSMEIRIEVMEEQLYFHVTKARFKGFFIPGSLVGRLIYGHLEPVSEFFFADEKIKLQDIIIDGNNISFVIN